MSQAAHVETTNMVALSLSFQSVELIAAAVMRGCKIAVRQYFEKQPVPKNFWVLVAYLYSTENETKMSDDIRWCSNWRSTTTHIITRATVRVAQAGVGVSDHRLVF